LGGPTEKTIKSVCIFGGLEKPPKIFVFSAVTRQTAKNNHGHQKIVFFPVVKCRTAGLFLAKVFLAKVVLKS
jgi:hypothetical protein